MSSTEIVSPVQGMVGYMHEIICEDKDSVLIFQLPRRTDMLSDVYIEGALRVVKECLPEGRLAMIIGSDVNIYTLAGVDAVALKLKGLF